MKGAFFKKIHDTITLTHTYLVLPDPQHLFFQSGKRINAERALGLCGDKREQKKGRIRQG